MDMENNAFQNAICKLSDSLFSPQCVQKHCGLVTPYGEIDLSQYWFRILRIQEPQRNHVTTLGYPDDLGVTSHDDFMLRGSQSRHTQL